MIFTPGSIVLLCLFIIVDSEEPTPLPVMAQVSVESGESRLFSGEDVELTCSVPEDPETLWRFHWFLNGKRLKTSPALSLQNSAVQQSGRYTCEGEHDIDTWPYSIKSLLSEPLTIHVDGGWALLRVPAEPVLIEEVLVLTCRVRDDPVLVEVIFYKDDVQIFRSRNKYLTFSSLSLKDQGVYRCRATWSSRFQHHSAQSQPANVTVLDKLNTPVLSLEVVRSPVRSGDDVVFRCETQLNVREEGHSVNYNFFKDGERLAPPSSHETFTIQRAEPSDAGRYTCKVRVRALKLERWSNQVELKLEE